MSAQGTILSPNPWTRILDALEKKINRHSYDTWLKPTRYSHASGGILFVRVPTAEFRHAGDKYADLIQEAIDNLGLEFNDVKFVTPDDDPAATAVRHNGGLSAGPVAPATPPSQARFDWDGAAQLNPCLLYTSGHAQFLQMQRALVPAIEGNFFVLGGRQMENFEGQQFDGANQFAVALKQQRGIGSGEVHKDFRLLPVGLRRGIDDDAVFEMESAVGDDGLQEFVDAVGGSEFIHRGSS